MAYQLVRRIAATEARLPQTPPIEATLCEEPWFLDFLTGQNLDLNQLKQTGSIIAAMPLGALQKLRVRLLAMATENS
jgi:hypothetical protein